MKAAVVRLAVILVVTALCQPASAFWNLFESRQVQPPPEQLFQSPLEDLRVGECGDPLASNKFGETEYMRGRRTRFELEPELQRALAAAFLVGTAQDAKAILAPYLKEGDEIGHAAARTGLAFALLRKAAGKPEIRAEARNLVSHPDVAERVDAEYIRGAVALHDRNWTEVAAAATRVLEQEPQHFNANVLRSLAILQSLAEDRSATSAPQCHATLARMIDALYPVMELGACPTQMAHLDVTSERYLNYRDRVSASRQGLLRRLILAYVSRNDSAASAILADYRAANGADLPCEASVRAFDLIPAPR